MKINKYRLVHFIFIYWSFKSYLFVLYVCMYIQARAIFTISFVWPRVDALPFYIIEYKQKADLMLKYNCRTTVTVTFIKVTLLWGLITSPKYGKGLPREARWTAWGTNSIWDALKLVYRVTREIIKVSWNPKFHLIFLVLLLHATG